MTTPDICPDRPAVKSVFTGDGMYELRDGTVLRVEKSRLGNLICQENARSFRSPCFWKDDGKWVSDFHTEYDIVARVDEPAETAKQGFRITGPGRYKDAGGRFATVERGKPNDRHFPWHGTDSLGRPASWKENGSWLWDDDEHDRNIVAGPFPDEAAPQADAKEFAGLTGYIGLVPKQDHLTWDTQTFVVRNYPVIIDLSTITKDQLVQPKPEPKRVNGWLNFFPKFILGPFATKAEADEAADRSVLIWKYPERIACIEVEFTEGDGLGAER